jgi:hypothetical protein
MAPGFINARICTNAFSAASVSATITAVRLQQSKYRASKLARRVLELSLRQRFARAQMPTKTSCMQTKSTQCYRVNTTILEGRETQAYRRLGRTTFRPPTWFWLPVPSRAVFKEVVGDAAQMFGWQQMCAVLWLLPSPSQTRQLKSL